VAIENVGRTLVPVSSIASMTCKGCGQVGRLTRTNMYQSNNTELSSLEGTRSEFNPSKEVSKLGIDVHQDWGP
jgi:hypothetical protein